MSGLNPEVVDSTVEPVKEARVARSGFLRVLLRATLKRKDVKAGFAILGFFIGAGILSLVWVPYSPLKSVGPLYTPPNHIFWFGTTNIGQDVFSQWLYGTRPTLLVGFFAALLTAGLGITTGIIAGYIRTADEPLMRAADVVLTLPALPLLIVLAVFFRPSDFSIAILIAVLSWAGMSRTLRSSVLSLKRLPFVEVAVLSNVPSYKIMFVDMLKHTLPLILTYSLFAVGGAILTVASLDFIGLGPLDYSWGDMIALANNNLALQAGAWWWFLFPGLSVAILVTGLALVAYGLEAAAKNM